MARRKQQTDTSGNKLYQPSVPFKPLTEAQEQAWEVYKQSSVLFLVGAAGTGKSYLATNFAIREVIDRQKEKIILSRPIIEAGEHLGFLPGDVDEKIHPYMVPLYDCIDKIAGKNRDLRDRIARSYEVAPLAYLRGRAQPLDELVLTPNGYRRMGDIKQGDEVISGNGEATTVLAVYPQGKKIAYKITLSDGSSTTCCGDHLWLTQTLYEKRHQKGYSVKTTNEISKTLKTKHNQKNHKIPIVSGPVRMEHQEVSIDAYLLGLLLGDGCFHPKTPVKFCTKDQELVEQISSRLPKSVQIVHRGRYDFELTTGHKSMKNPLRRQIKEFGLMGKKSQEKFVPREYLYNSVEIRSDILAGLLDSDGWISETKHGCRIGFSTASQQLAEDVRFLVESLGGISYLRKREYCDDDSHLLRNRLIRHTCPSYCLDIVIPHNPFKLTRKASKYKNMKPVRLVAKIEEIGEVECQCIAVDHEDRLYLTRHCVVTHNTFEDSICILDEAQNCTKSQLKLFLTRMGRNSRMIITGDPSQSDLPNNCDLMDVVARVGNLDGVGTVYFNEECCVRHPLVTEFIKRL